MLTSTVTAVVTGFALIVMAYFAIWHTSQMAMGVVAWVGVWRHRLTRTRRDLVLARRFEATPLVSVIVPAFNEAVTIVDSVRALLALDYYPREIVVVNDGSSDGTLALLQETFRLIAAPLAFDQPLPTEPVRGIYRSIQHPGLVVIDKQNGGSKSDALNAGVNVASGQFVLTIDADTVLEPDALSRAILPVLDDPTTVAVAGNVAIANGCRIEAGRITEVALPRSWTARLQIVEYMRSFLLFRVATAALNGIVIISGAFGLFRRDAVVAIGGYDRSAIGEDMDLTLRLQRHYRERREPFRIAFDPFPLCSTQAPEDLKSLRNQRYRWRRGLLQSLWRHRGMIGNPRMGSVGLGVLPYVAFFEGIGPLLEVAGYAITTVAAFMGLLSWTHYWLLIFVALSFGAAATLLAVLLSDLAMQRYLNRRDLVLLVAAALLENVGYRQLNSWWACVGTVQALSGRQGWGVVTRRVFERRT